MTSFVLTVLAASVGAEPLPELLRQDFRGGKITEPVLKRVGQTPERYMKGEALGLRITLPGKQALAPVGVSSRLAVHGDFEITLTYQILKADKPSTGYGAGVSLWVSSTEAGDATATLARFVRPKEGDVYSTDHASNGPDGKRKHRDRRFPSESSTGRLRLVRSGPTLLYLVANGNDSDFRELRKEEFGSEPLKAVRVAAETGGAPVAVDVRLIDLEIRAKELSASPPPAHTARRSDWWVWCAALAAGAVLALGGLFYRRRSRSRASEQKPH
jgi:hypothetical protein